MRWCIGRQEGTLGPGSTFQKSQHGLCQTLDSSDTGMQRCRLQVQLEQCWVRREDSLLLKLKAGVDRKPGEALRKCTVALAEWRPCMCVD